jgi:hypothetical protein
MAAPQRSHRERRSALKGQRWHAAWCSLLSGLSWKEVSPRAGRYDRDAGAAIDWPYGQEESMGSPIPPYSHRVLVTELHAHDRARGRFVAGADEAGRGCLAGPLVGAAVLLDLDRPGLFELLGGVNDSKKLTANRRRSLMPRILVAAERVAVRIVDSEEIDRNGIQEANRRVLEEALRAVAPAPGERMLVDYFKLPNIRSSPSPEATPPL